MALATHLFVNTAILRLAELNCASCPVAQAKCRTAASHVSLHLDRARLGEWERADPIFGPLLGIIADVLMNILPCVPEVASNLQTTLEALRTLARCSPCIQRCLVATEQQQAQGSTPIPMDGEWIMDVDVPVPEEVQGHAYSGTSATQGTSGLSLS
ncbi:hypothetical protein C8R46DRAFT_1077440 [Mycena filopes]|nr:hypothetical protein C8R46DRAFT_1077440 [Mycena filopes]